MTKNNTKKSATNERRVNTVTGRTNNDYIGKVKRTVSKEVPTEIKIQAKNDSQTKLIQSIKNNDITICSGVAGSGKTYIAVGIALSLLRKSGSKIKKIYLTKSVTTLKNEDLGHLRGDIKEKFDPYMISFYINMEKIIGEDALKSLIDQDIIRPYPLAFISGATIDDAVIIGDELQNVSLDNAHRLITRIGTNSKLILLGDTRQIDLRNKSESSLDKLLTIFENCEEIGTIRMNDNDLNLRHPIISLIEKKMDEYNNSLL